MGKLIMDRSEFRASVPDLDSIRIIIRRRDHTSPTMMIITQALSAIATGILPKDLAEIIGRDPSLSLKVARVASTSAFFAGEVRSIRHAIELLGPLQVANILSSIQMAKQSEGLKSVEGIDQAAFRRRSLLAAGIARTIALKTGAVDSDMAYIAGLLLDCGYLGIAGIFPRELSMVAMSASLSPNEDIRNIEKYYLGFEHTEVSELMTTEYGLAPAICEASRWHHDPIFASEGNRPSADILHIADWIAGELGFSPFPHSKGVRLDMYACKRLGVEPGSLESMLEHLKTEALQHDEAMNAIAA